MWKLRKLIVHLLKFIEHRGIGRGRDKRVNYLQFVDYLVRRKRFLEDWRDTLIRSLPFFREKHCKSGLIRTEKQREDIRKIIEFGVDKDFIFEGCMFGNVKPRSKLETYLQVRSGGERFIKPLTWLNETLSNYSYVQGFLIGVLSGGALLLLADILIGVLRWAWGWFFLT